MRTQNLRIIIPSIGREEIAKTLEAIISDAESNLDTVTTTVTIIADGKVAYEILEKFFESAFKLTFENVKLSLILNQGVGVSAALNTGLKQVMPNEVFMIFTDDDNWRIGRIHSLVHELMSRPNIDVLLSCAQVVDENSNHIRPREQIAENENILTYLYGGCPFFENPHYFSLVTSISKYPISQILFPEGIQSHEDVIWLSNIQGRGFRIGGCDAVTGQLNVSLVRSFDRATAGKDEYFLNWLNARDSTIFQNYFWVHAGRSFAAIGRPFKLISYWKQNRKNVGLTFKQFRIAFFLLAVSLVKGLLNRRG